MPKKNAKQYLLPLNIKYEIISARYGDAMDLTTCDNCNKAIKNIVHIKDENNVHHNVGLDCAKTLSQIEEKHLKTVETYFKHATNARNSFNKVKRESVLCEISSELVITPERAEVKYEAYNYSNYLRTRKIIRYAKTKWVDDIICPMLDGMCGVYYKKELIDFDIVKAMKHVPLNIPTGKSPYDFIVIHFDETKFEYAIKYNYSEEKIDYASVQKVIGSMAEKNLLTVEQITR